MAMKRATKRPVGRQNLIANPVLCENSANEATRPRGSRT